MTNEHYQPLDGAAFDALFAAGVSLNEWLVNHRDELRVAGARV